MSEWYDGDTLNETKLPKYSKGLFDNETTWQDIGKFVKFRFEHPITINIPQKNKTYLIYNFSPHGIDLSAMKTFLTHTNFPGFRFILPHPMTAAWTFMISWLPKDTINKHCYLNYNTRTEKYMIVYPPKVSKNIFSYKDSEEEISD